MFDILRRYFVKNSAPIFLVERRIWRTKFTLCRCGNAYGFNWGYWKVIWRRPYTKEWSFNGKNWVPSYMLEKNNE